jgi:hypothetical protein
MKKKILLLNDEKNKKVTLIAPISVHDHIIFESKRESGKNKLAHFRV